VSDSHDDHQHDDEIDCTIAIEQFYAYLDDELKNADDIAKFEQHIDHCKSCFTRLQLEQALNTRMRQNETKEIPNSLERRLKNLIKNF